MKRLNILSVALLSAFVLCPGAAYAKDGTYAYERFKERVAKVTKKPKSAPQQEERLKVNKVRTGFPI